MDAVCSVRAKLNRPDFIIGYRLSPEEPGENGITMTDTLELVKALMDKPLQYLHVSQWNFNKSVRRGSGEGSSRLKVIHDTLKGKLPLIGLGSLFTMDDYIGAMKSGYIEFVGSGKSIMINPHLGTRLYEGKADEIATELDPDKADHYGIPAPLWAMCQSGDSWLPPLKGSHRKEEDSNTLQGY